MRTLLRILLIVVALAAVTIVGGYFALKRDDISYATLETRYANPADKFIDLPSVAGESMVLFGLVAAYYAVRSQAFKWPSVGLGTVVARSGTRLTPAGPPV